MEMQTVLVANLVQAHRKIMVCTDGKITSQTKVKTERTGVWKIADYSLNEYQGLLQVQLRVDS